MLTQDAAVQLQSFAVVRVPAATEGQAMSRATTWRSDGSSRTPELSLGQPRQQQRQHGDYWQQRQQQQHQQQ